MTTLKNETFKEAEASWDLERLYADLADVKGELLTLTERLNLRGLLCGYTPAELADLRIKDTLGLQADVCSTVRRYVKDLQRKGKVDQIPKRMSSEKMLEVLKESGYYRKTARASTVETEKILPIKNLEGPAKVAVINNKISGNNEIIHIEIEKLTLSFSAEQLKELLNSVVGGDGEKQQLVNTLVNLVKTVVGGEKKDPK